MSEKISSQNYANRADPAKEASRNEAWGVDPKEFANGNEYVSNRPDTEVSADVNDVIFAKTDSESVYGDRSLLDIAHMVREANEAQDKSVSFELQAEIQDRLQQFVDSGQLTEEGAMNRLGQLVAVWSDSESAGVVPSDEAENPEPTVGEAADTPEDDAPAISEQPYLEAEDQRLKAAEDRKEAARAAAETEAELEDVSDDDLEEELSGEQQPRRFTAPSGFDDETGLMTAGSNKSEVEKTAELIDKLKEYGFEAGDKLTRKSADGQEYYWQIEGASANAIGMRNLKDGEIHSFTPEEFFGSVWEDYGEVPVPAGRKLDDMERQPGHEDAHLNVKDRARALADRALHNGLASKASQYAGKLVPEKVKNSEKLRAASGGFGLAVSSFMNFLSKGKEKAWDERSKRTRIGAGLALATGVLTYVYVNKYGFSLPGSHDSGIDSAVLTSANGSGSESAFDGLKDAVGEPATTPAAETFRFPNDPQAGLGAEKLNEVAGTVNGNWNIPQGGGLIDAMERNGLDSSKLTAEVMNYLLTTFPDEFEPHTYANGVADLWVSKPGDLSAAVTAYIQSLK